MRIALTDKRRGAIITYVRLKAAYMDGGLTLPNVVNVTLKAERTRSESIYRFIESRGYRWRRGAWRE